MLTAVEANFRLFGLSLSAISIIMSPGESLPPPIPGDQPHPVLVGPGMKTLGEEAYAGASKVTPSALDSDRKHPVDTDAPSYFHDVAVSGPDHSSPSSPVQAARDAKTPKEVLRRLSLADTGSFPNLPQPDPRQQYPGLKLTGRIISAAFCIPYRVRFHSDFEWVCLVIRLASSSFSRLSHSFSSCLSLPILKLH